MKRYKYDQLRRAQEKKLYYKMYKAGKNWIIAGLTMVGFSFMFSMAAKADVDEQRPNTENLDIQAEKEQQNIAQVTSTDTNEQLVVTETPTTSNNEPKENEATPAKVETGENTVESAKQPEPQVATNEVVASRAEDTTPVIRRARTVASTTAVTEDDIDQKTVRTENMIDWLQDGLFSGDNKNALTTPILPNDQNGKRNNQAPFDINSAAMSQLSYNTLYYPFVKKLQAAYKAEDYKELTNMAAILQAIYGKVNTEQLITGIFTPEDNYKADQALANAKLNRSVAVIVSMDQDGHILSQSVGLPDSFVTGSGSGYKVEDGSLEDTGYISWPSAILDIVVGKNGTDMISYDPARAATIPNDPPKTLGVYKYIGSEYYHSTVNQDLIKYADNDPMKTKFAVADYSANKKKIIPEGHALTYIINRYQTQVAPVDKTAQTTITYKGNKGNVLTVPAGSQVKVSGKEGQEVEILTPPTIKGYTFNFPRFNGQRTSVGSKVTLEKSNELIYFYIADPVPAKVTVAYKSGDTVLTPATPVQLTGNIDDEVSVPSPPTISGYTFNNVLLNGEASSIGATVTLAENNTLVYNYRKDAANAVTEVVYQNVNGESQTAVLGKIDTRSIPKKAGLKYTITDGPEAVIPGKGIQPAMKILFNGQEVTKGQVVTLLEKNTLTYIFPARTTTPTQKPAVTTVSYKAGTETLDPTTPVTLTGNVGTKVNVPTAPTVIGYTLEKVKFNGAEVPVGSQVTLLATNTLEYSYTKDSEIATTTVEYKSGETPVTPTTSVTLTGNVGSEVSVPAAPAVAGYHYVNATFNGKAVTPNSKVTLEKANKLVYNYVKDPEVATTTVEYKSGETPVTPTTSVTLTGNVGSEVTVPTAPTVAGYHYVNATFNGKAVTPNSKVTLEKANKLVYNYVKDPEVATTTVEYKSGETPVTPTTSVTLTGNVGSEVTVPTAPTVAGYHYVNATFNGKAVTPNSKVTLEKANKLVYNYAKDPEMATTTVEYKSGETPVTPTTSVTLTGNVGSEVSVPAAPAAAGYHYVNATFNGKAVTPNSKVTLEKANKLVYNYAKDPEVAETTVSYKAGTETLNPTTPVTLTGNVGTKVSIPTAPTVTGYTLEKVKFNGTDVSAGSLVTLLATNTLEYSYTKDPEAAKTMVNYKAGTEALIPTALVTLTGNVGDEVTVPTAPVVSGYTFKNMTFNGTEVKAGSKVTLEKTNTLAYNYTKNAKQPTTSNVTIYYRDVNDSKDDKYTANSGTLLAQYTQALRGEVGNVYANTLSEVEQAGYMVAKSDTGVLSGSYLANDATYYVYLTHAKKEQTHQVTVTRTIQYQDETGSSVAKAVEQKQVFDVTEMVDQVNKQVVSTKYAPANATFEQVISPVKDGYIFEKAVPAKEITATSPSETVTVGYKAQPQKLTYTVVDKDEGDKVLVKEQLLATGTTDQVLSATAKDAYQAVVDDYRKAGYKVVELPELPSSFDTDPTNDQNLVFVLAHDTKKVPGKSKEVTVRVTYRYGNGPKQGESVAKTKEQVLTFTSLETRDAVTDKVLETKWSEPQQSDTFKSPNVVNYVADKKQVGALEVTAAMGPQNLEVNYYTAQAKEDLETPWGELPVASSVIQNTAELAQLGSKTYIWKKQPNVEPIGYQSHTSKGVVSVVYADGTEQEVPVTVKVAPQAKNYAPKAKAETVTVSVGQLPAPESLIADFEQLPDGTKASWGVVPDVTKEGTSTGLIEVLYPDNTRDLVEVALEVKADLAKKETIPAKPFLAEMRENGEQKVGRSKKQVNDQSGEKLPQTGEKEEKVSIFGALVMTLAGALGMNVTIKKKRK